MGKYFTFALQLPFYNEQKQKEKESVKRWSLSVQSSQIGFIILVLLVSSFFIYIYEVNSFSTKGYEINRLQYQLSQIAEQHKNLEIQAAQLQSIQRIQTDPAVMGMVPVKNISYIQTTALSEK